MFEKFYRNYLDESFESHILVQHISGMKHADDMAQLLAQAQNLVKYHLSHNALWRAPAAKHLLDNAIEWQDNDEDSAYGSFSAYIVEGQIKDMVLSDAYIDG